MKFFSTIVSSLALLVLAQAVPALSQSAATQPGWQRLDGLVTCVASVADDPSTFFIGTGGDLVMRTTDGGATWTGGGLRREGSILGIAALSADTLLAGSSADNSAVYRSVDGGTTWTRLTFPVQSFLMRVQHIGGRAALLGQTSGGYLITRDAGESIDTLLRAGTLLTAGDGSIVQLTAKNTGAVYRSDDLGLSWQLVAATPSTTGTMPRYSNGQSYFIADANRIAIAEGRESTVVVSNDGGATWVGTELPGRDVRSLAWLSNTELLSIDVTRGAARSMDGGATWADATSSLPTADDFRSANVFIGALPGGTAVYARANSLYVYDGNSWTLRRLLLPAENFRRLSPAGQGQVFSYWANTQFQQLSGNYGSSNGGITWEALPNSDGRIDYAVGVDTVLAVAGARLTRSTDGGQTYAEVANTGSGFSPFHRVFADGAGTIYAASSSRLFASVDRGASWTALQAPGALFSQGVISAFANPDGLIVISTPAGSVANQSLILVSRDGGVTFNIVDAPPNNGAGGVLALTPDGTLFVEPKWMSQDVGTTLEDLTSVANLPNGTYDYVGFRDSDIGLFSDFRGAAFATYDGGQSWQGNVTGTYTGFAVNSNVMAFHSPDEGYSAGLALHRYQEVVPEEVMLPLTGSSSLRQNLSATQLRFSPNPIAAGGRVHFSDQSLTLDVKVFSVDGRLQGSFHVQRGQGTLPQNLPHGLYLLQTREGSVGRVVVQD